MTNAPTLRDKTKRGLLWASAEAGARTLLQTLVLIVLSRLLTPEDYGVVGAALIVIGISTIFSQLGVGPAIVQRSELNGEHLDAAFAMSLLFGLVTAAVIYFGAPLFTTFFAPNDPTMQGLTPTLRALCIVFPIAAIGVVSESLLQRDLRFDLIARSEVLSYFIGFGIVAVVLAFCRWGAWALVCGQVVQAIVKTDLLFGFISWRPKFACKRRAVGELMHFSIGLTLARLANYVATNGDNVVVGRWLGAGALGIYGRAYQLMSSPANLIGNVLEKVLFPAMAKVQGNHGQLARVYRQGVGLLATLMLPGSVAIFLLAPEVVPVLLGPRWSGVVFPLQIFSLALLFRTSMKMSNSLIRAKGAVYQMAWCQAIYAVTTVGFAWAGRSWGIEGVCMGVFASIVLCFIIAASISLRLVGVSWLEFIADHMPGLALAALVYAVGWLPCAWLRPQHAPPLVILVTSLAAMGFVALGAAALFPKIFLGPEGARMSDRARLFLRLRPTS